MTPFATLERHRAECTECDLFKLCPVGAGLLERAAKQTAERMCPAPLVIDLPGHMETCGECNQRSLCPIGQEIADERTTAWIDAGAKRNKDEPPC